MSVAEFAMWCVGGALAGWTFGALLADPRGVLEPIWWAIVDVVTLRVVRDWRRP